MAPAEAPGRIDPALPAGRSAHRFEGLVMASPLRLTVAGDGLDEASAMTAWLAVSDEFDAVDQAMSRFRPDSGVTRLNATAGTGRTEALDGRLYRAVAACCRAWRLTGGRFDPRVLADLERLGYPGTPLDSAGTTAAASVDRPWLERWPRRSRARLAAPIDLGGIGKGLALRWSARRLVATLPVASAPGFLLEAGGDLVVNGLSPEGGAWRLGIEDPGGGAEPVAVVGLRRGALCTSSTLVNRWRSSDGREVHHLIDPATREPGGHGLRSVSVAGTDPAWSEVWSKALFLAGARGILDDAAGQRLAAWWVDANGRLAMTPEARGLTIWH